MHHETRVTRRRVLATGTAAAASAAFVGGGRPSAVFAASQSTPEAPAAPTGGQVSLSMASSPASFNPLFVTAGFIQGITRQLYGALVMMTHEQDPQPDLAESIDISDDGTEYTFHLKEGLTFSDGEPLTSADVIFTINRSVDPRTGSVWRSRLLAIAGAEEYDGETVTSISGLEAVDDLTVKMTLTAPDATWLITLGDFAGYCILPEHAFGDIPPDQLQEADFSFNPTPSAGAFVLDEWVTDQYLSISRNDAYPGQKANIDSLYVKVLPQPATALSQLQNGELDILQVSVPDLEVVQQNPNVTISTSPSLMLDFIALNSTRPAFADKRARQALMYALDRESIVRDIYMGYARVVNSPIFGPEWLGDPEPEGLNTYPYDPEKARALLEEANFPFDQPVVMPYVAGNQLSDTVRNIMQQQYKDVGVNVELLAVDTAEYTSRLITGATGGEPGDFDLTLGGGGVFGQDPNVSIKYLATEAATPSGQNYSHYSNPRVDELFALGRATTDLEERKTLYTELAQILNDEIPWVFLWSPDSIYGVNNRIQGFVAPGHPGRLVSSAHEWSIVE